MSKFNSLKSGALAAILLIGSVPAVRAAAALESTPKSGAAGSSEPCVVTAAQHQEMTAIHKEVGDLVAARAPLGERVNATLVRIDRLSHELIRCLEPQVKSMIAQAGNGPSPELVERVRTTAVRLASGETMTDEGRNRLTEQLASDTAKLRSETGTGSMNTKELQEQNRIFNNNMNSDTGTALRQLDKAKHELLRLRG